MQLHWLSTLVVLVSAFERSFQANAKKVLANAFVVHVTMTSHRLTVGKAGDTYPLNRRRHYSNCRLRKIFRSDRTLCLNVNAKPP